MDVGRRTVVKGMAAGGALLAFGAPRWAFGAPVADPRAARCVLLLGDVDAHAGVARGARGLLARAGCVERALVAPPGGVLAAPDAVRARLAQARGTRWIALLDDAAAAVFQELVRGVDGRLLSRGHHTATATADGTARRAAWMAASPAWAAGALLAASLAAPAAGVSISESFVADRPAAPPPRGADALLIPTDDWCAGVGQAVAACALGLGAGRRLPGDHAAWPGRHAAGPGHPFVSFVVDC